MHPRQACPSPKTVQYVRLSLASSSSPQASFSPVNRPQPLLSALSGALFPLRKLSDLPFPSLAESSVSLLYSERSLSLFCADRTVSLFYAESSVSLLYSQQDFFCQPLCPVLFSVASQSKKPGSVIH